ncbi:MAG: 3'(2'),5'-bisphosphate nucleotidase CysQ [Bacteroidales bacterium]
MQNQEYKELLTTAVKAALLAGKEINTVYGQSDFEVEEKEDETPLTLADRKAHEKIKAYLKETDIPLLSEEGRDIPYSERESWDYFWLVDPLDGTKEFIKRNGEFTVNIALIHKGKPILGVVFAPYVSDLYFGCEKFGAYKIEGVDEQLMKFEDLDELMKAGDILPKKSDRKELIIVASRSHMNDDTQQYVDALREKFGDAKFVSKGSSLKICMVAEGGADVYPRFAPTMEWDTAAGHAVALAAGFLVTEKDEKTPLRYNKKELKNPWFIVKGKRIGA